MSRALPKYNKRRVGIIGGAAAVVLSGAVIAGSALAGEGANKDGQDAASPGTIACRNAGRETASSTGASPSPMVCQSMTVTGPTMSRPR